MTAVGSPHEGASWKYKFGLLLILAVVIIWVGSAEITQLIFEKYRHPFLLTWLGASLLVFYLPLAYLKEWLAPYFARWTSKLPGQNSAGAARTPMGGKVHKSAENLRQTASAGPHNGHGQSHSHGHGHGHSHPVTQTFSVGAGHHSAANGPHHAGHAKEIELVVAAKTAAPHATRVAIRSPTSRRGEDNELEEEEGAPLLASAQDASLSKPAQPPQLTTKQVAACALLLAPMWLLTEYLSNAALSMTSVASTTILSSTSCLFTLLFGVTVGGDSLTTGKLLAALVSIAGVMMTELGKSSASDDSTVFGDADRNPGETAGDIGLPGHNLVGDICGLLSAVSYGFYTTLLRKYVGGDEEGGEEKADLQKVFGFIGLFTLVGLWWLAFPLHLIGWEPVPALPSTYGLDEDILANGLVGSMISDYFWAVSVVWTTPLVATLGLSLTIPLAMVADMLVHGRDYSLTYVLGAGGVFAGFIVANLSDNWCSGLCIPDGFFHRMAASCSSCLPAWLRKPSPSPRLEAPEEAASMDKEFN